MLNKGLELTKTNLLVIKLISEEGFSGAFSLEEYTEICRYRTKAFLNIDMAKSYLEDTIKKGWIYTLKDGEHTKYEMSGYAGDLIKVFSEIEQSMDTLIDAKDVSVLHYLNLLKVCYFIGEDRVFSQGDMGLLWEAVTGEKRNNAFIVSFLSAAKENEHIKEVEHADGSYQITPELIAMARAMFPIKGIFEIREIDSRITVSDISVGSPLEIVHLPIADDVQDEHEDSIDAETKLLHDDLILQEGLDRPGYATFVLIYVLMRSEDCLMKKRFLVGEYWTEYQTITEKKVGQPTANWQLQRACEKNCLKKYNNKKFEATEHTKKLVKLFSDPEEILTVWRDTGSISALNYMNVLKVCSFIGEEIIFSTNELEKLYREVTMEKLEKRPLIVRFIKTARRKGHIVTEEHSRYRLTHKGMIVAKKAFPIIGVFNMEEIKRRIAESGIVVGTSVEEAEGPKNSTVTFCWGNRIETCYNAPLQDIIVPGRFVELPDGRIVPESECHRYIRDIQIEPEIAVRSKEELKEEIVEEVMDELAYLLTGKDNSTKDWGWIIFCRWIIEQMNIRSGLFDKVLIDIDSELEKMPIENTSFHKNIFKEFDVLLGVDIETIKKLSNKAIIGKLRNNLELMDTSSSGIRRNIDLLRKFFLYISSENIKGCAEHIAALANHNYPKLQWHANLLSLFIEGEISFDESFDREIILYYLKETDTNALEMTELRDILMKKINYLLNKYKLQSMDL
ncbi:MAG: hypothetical protein KKD11_07080 [Candidatus Omnitrophica bacterium]|nr:hypothetical protein [Candidatus Omnitrophota bacterium]